MFYMSRVSELEQNIREIFNIPRRHKKSRQDHAAFLQACSALDVIGDTELAFHDYKEADITLGEGLRYILAYGLLQAVFLQQDAIKHLTLSLGLPFELPNELREIRELRNDAVGHPTNKSEKGDIKSFHHISRPTLSKHGFQLLSGYSNELKPRIRDINLLNILKIQADFSQGLLERVLEQLRQEENVHRGKYMEDKLAEIFHSTLGYLFEKVREGIYLQDEAYRSFGLANFNTIVGYLEKFESKLQERGEEEAIKDIKTELEYPINKVRAYLAKSEVVDQHAAEIFIKYIEEKFEDLKDIAQEVDDEYKNKV